MHVQAVKQGSRPADGDVGSSRGEALQAAALDRLHDVTGNSITDRDFQDLRNLIHRLSGINLTSEKRVLLVGRLNKRLRALGLRSFRQYAELLQDGANTAETTHMLDCICTNETHFFREPQQFQFLESTVFPRWKALGREHSRRRHLKIWSAGCSTGEEPYSIAMTLLDHFPAQEGWTLDILGTDLSTQALDRAIQGEWSMERATEVPDRYLKRFMLRGTGSKEGLMAAGPELRGTVRFKLVNLARGEHFQEKDFDIVFCRNVIIYFDQTTKTEVVRKVVAHLAPGGFLLLGHAESIHDSTCRIERLIPSVYTLLPAAAGA